MSFTYPHMCRDDHVEVGHSDSEHEMCPLCRANADNQRLRALLADQPRTMVAEKLRKEAARGGAKDGSECCYAPWTCCDPKVLTDAAAELDRLTAIVDTPPRIHDPMALYGATHDQIVEALAEMMCILTKAEADVIAERRRQITVEGWTAEHDSLHNASQLALAAVCYAIPRGSWFRDSGEMLKRLWPWEDKFWKPKDRRRDLIRAAALLVAEVERLEGRLPAATSRGDAAKAALDTRAAAIEECAKVAETEKPFTFTPSRSRPMTAKEIATAIRALAGPNGETKS